MPQGTPTGIEGAVKPSSLEVDGYEGTVFAHRHIVIETNQQGQWEYDGSGNVLYAGYAPRGLATTSSGWLLQKFTVNGSNQVTARQIAYDTWSNRAAASYA